MVVSMSMYRAWHGTSVCHGSRRDRQTELDARLHVAVQERSVECEAGH